MENTALHQILTTLYIHTQFVGKAGLLQGRAGIALFLFRYQQKTGCTYYKDFTELVYQSVFAQYPSKVTPYFTNGLPGIGWIKNYLLKQKLIPETRLLLAELDQTDKMVMRLNENSFFDEIEQEDALFAKGLYFISRGNVEGLVKAQENLFRFFQLLENKKKNLPLSYLNSILYTLIYMYDKDLNKDKVILLLDQLLPCVIRSLRNKLYTHSERMILRKQIQSFTSFLCTDIINVEQWINLLDELCEKEMELKEMINLNWKYFLYGYTDDSLFQGIKAAPDKCVKEYIFNLDCYKEIGLKNGLAGLGMSLL